MTEFCGHKWRERAAFQKLADAKKMDGHMRIVHKKEMNSFPDSDWGRGDLISHAAGMQVDRCMETLRNTQCLLSVPIEE
jgi:hypothetical protein